MRTEVTLSLACQPGADVPASKIVSELFALGGWMTDWIPGVNRSFGTATFVFADKHSCTRFTNAALRIGGVYPVLRFSGSMAHDKTMSAETSGAT